MLGAEAQLLLVDWRALREPFVLPLGLHHCAFEDWESIDCDLAACAICGASHACDAATCPLVCTEGRQVCEITGYCVKNAVFENDPFSNTCCLKFTGPHNNSGSSLSCIGGKNPPSRRSGGGGGGKKRRGLERAAMRLRDEGGGDPLSHDPSDTGPATAAGGRRTALNEDQIGEWVHELLCSARTRASLEQEQRRRAARLNTLFTKLARKAHSHREPLNLVQACTTMAASTTTIRLPRLLEAHELRSVATQCHEALIRFLRVFLDRARATIPAVKTKGFVIGTLYLMRCGICLCDSVQVLARVPLLGWVLPLENQLQPCFQLSTKIITEAENTIKSALRGLTRQELMGMGFVAY